MKCTGLGYFVSNPLLRKHEDTHVCEFVLEITERSRRKDKTVKFVNRFSFTTWDSAATTIAKYAKQGDAIYFEATPRYTSGGQLVFRISDFELVSNEQVE